MKLPLQKLSIIAFAALISTTGSANANSLLFPYFTTNAGTQSILTIRSNNAASNEALHYVYQYGSKCARYDQYGKMARNDLLQHSIASPAIGGTGKVIASDASNPVYLPVANTQGFLVVSTKTNAAANISGEMTIIDPSIGLVATYAGISNGHTDTTGSSEGDFSNITDHKFDLSLLNDSIGTTKWYAVVVGDMSRTIASGGSWGGAQTLSSNGLAYDNDGVPFSGYSWKPITCSGIVSKSDLMTNAQAAATASANPLIHATSTDPYASSTDKYLPKSTGLVLMKMQSFGGNSTLHREEASEF